MENMNALYAMEQIWIAVIITAAMLLQNRTIVQTAEQGWTRWNNMETVNCMQCDYRHKNNGNCTAVGGFCTSVPAAHCPMLRVYLNTGLTPEECTNAANIIRIAFSDDTSKAERIRKLLKADEEGRLIVLPEGEKSNDQ